MNNKNNNGPTIDPCGTPDLVFRLSEFCPFNDKICFLLVSYDSNHFSAVLPHLYSSSFLQRIGILIISNAFLKSSITQPT